MLLILNSDEYGKSYAKAEYHTDLSYIWKMSKQWGNNNEVPLGGGGGTWAMGSPSPHVALMWE